MPGAPGLVETRHGKTNHITCVQRSSSSTVVDGKQRNCSRFPPRTPYLYPVWPAQETRPQQRAAGASIPEPMTGRLRPDAGGRIRPGRVGCWFYFPVPFFTFFGPPKSDLTSDHHDFPPLHHGSGNPITCFNSLKQSDSVTALLQPPLSCFPPFRLPPSASRLFSTSSVLIPLHFHHPPPARNFPSLVRADRCCALPTQAATRITALCSHRPTWSAPCQHGVSGPLWQWPSPAVAPGRGGAYPPQFCCYRTGQNLRVCM